jgi:hypothetical protein
VTTEIEAFRSKLRDIAEARLSLYIREMGEDFYGKLVANKANWRAGYLPAHGVFAVFPQTVKGDVIVGPMTVVKWTDEELRDLGVPSEDLSDLMREAANVGFQLWANHHCDFCGKKGARDLGGDFVCDDCASRRVTDEGWVQLGSDPEVRSSC